MALLMSACTKGNLDMLGLFYTLSEGSDERFAQSMEYNATHAFDTIRLEDEQYHFYVMTDIHVDFTANNVDTFVSHYKADPDAAPFCLCLGDFINAVDHYEYCMAHVGAIWNNAVHHQAGRHDTCYAALGNHDMYYDQWKLYRGFYPTTSYAFVVQTPKHRDLYICFDSANGTVGAAQMKWLENILRETQGEDYRHRILFTHTHLFKKDESQGHTSNFALEETYELAAMFQKYDVELVLQGHSHHRDLSIFKGVKYLRLDAMEDHYYNAFYTIIEVGEQCSWKYVPVGPQDPEVEQTRIPGVPC